jgi:hypothetical protein
MYNYPPDWRDSRLLHKNLPPRTPSPRRHAVCVINSVYVHTIVVYNILVVLALRKLEQFIEYDPWLFAEGAMVVFVGYILHKVLDCNSCVLGATEVDIPRFKQ